MIQFLLPFIRNISLKQILIFIALSSIAFFVWSYLNLVGDNSKLEEKIKQLTNSLNAEKILLEKCYSEKTKLRDDILELEKEINILTDETFEVLGNICVREDTVENLNKNVKKEKIPDKNKKVLELEKSLNNRYNDRRF